MSDQQETNITLALTGSPQPGGKFRILAITAGNANGYTFPANVLEASLPLWQDAHVFINHDPGRPMRDLRDLAGICSTPSWDPATQGITLSVSPSGPSALLLDALGTELLSEGPHPKIGFSADLFIQHTRKEVTRIVKVNSVDLVFNPARGGAFIRA